VHGDVAGDVVKDVGLGQVVHHLFGPDGDGGGELAAAEAIEEEETGDVSADGFGLKTGQRLEAPVDFRKARDAVAGKSEGFDAVQEVAVGIAFPARAEALIEELPSLMIFFRIQVVSLCNVKLSAISSLFHEGGMAGGEAVLG